MINHFPNSFAIAAQQGHSHPSYAGGGGVHIIQIRLRPVLALPFFMVVVVLALVQE
jgi:hypothetical protein